MDVKWQKKEADYKGRRGLRGRLLPSLNNNKEIIKPQPANLLCSCQSAKETLVLLLCVCVCVNLARPQVVQQMHKSSHSLRLCRGLTLISCREDRDTGVNALRLITAASDPWVHVAQRDVLRTVCPPLRVLGRWEGVLHQDQSHVGEMFSSGLALCWNKLLTLSHCSHWSPSTLRGQCMYLFI